MAVVHISVDFFVLHLTHWWLVVENCRLFPNWKIGAKLRPGSIVRCQDPVRPLFGCCIMTAYTRCPRYDLLRRHLLVCTWHMIVCSHFYGDIWAQYSFLVLSCTLEMKGQAQASSDHQMNDQMDIHRMTVACFWFRMKLKRCCQIIATRPCWLFLLGHRWAVWMYCPTASQHNPKHTHPKSGTGPTRRVPWARVTASCLQVYLGEGACCTMLSIWYCHTWVHVTADALWKTTLCWSALENRLLPQNHKSQCTNIMHYEMCYTVVQLYRGNISSSCSNDRWSMKPRFFSRNVNEICCVLCSGFAYIIVVWTVNMLVWAGDALARLTWNYYPSLLHRPSVRLMLQGMLVITLCAFMLTTSGLLNSSMGQSPICRDPFLLLFSKRVCLTNITSIIALTCCPCRVREYVDHTLIRIVIVAMMIIIIADLCSH